MPIARLTNIVEAVQLTRSEMAGVTLQAFEHDRRKRWLVERGIEIISEASRHLSDELKAGRLVHPRAVAPTARCGDRRVGKIPRYQSLATMCRQSRESLPARSCA
jgi:hypothetical protein